MTENIKNNVVTSSEDGTSSDILFMKRMEAEMSKFVETLSVSSVRFDEKVAFEELRCYLRSYGKMMYVPISNAIYSAYKRQDDKDLIGSIITNIEKLARYIESSGFSDSNDAEKTVLKNSVVKLWDHVNLASQQYLNLKQTDEEYDKKFDVNFKNSFDLYKIELTKEVNSQLLTLVSIFTALAFLVFGSISSLDNIFSVSGVPILKVMLTGIIWGLCVLNLVFIFLYCVSKMTHLKIMTSADDNVSVFKRYPLVRWVNFPLISLLVICSWFYFLQSNGIDSWSSLATNGIEVCWLLLGSIGLFALIVLGFGFLLFKLTGLGGKEGEYKFSWKCFITIILCWVFYLHSKQAFKRRRFCGSLY